MKKKIAVSILAVTLLGFFAFGLMTPVTGVQASTGPAGAPARDGKATPGPWRETLQPVRETLAALPTQDGSDLENLLKRERLTLSNQQTRITLSHTVASTAQAYIDSQKSAGKDVSALETALTNFNQAITKAESANKAAADLLANPAGFDANGQVTDRIAARQTLHDAGQDLRQAHQALTSATLDLRTALKTFRGK